METQNQKIGAWKKQTAKGETYISFTIDGKKYSMWVNKYKKEDRHPDYQITEFKPKPTEYFKGDTPFKEDFINSITNDDIPF